MSPITLAYGCLARAKARSADPFEKLAAICTPQGANQPETTPEDGAVTRSAAMRLRHDDGAAPGTELAGGFSLRHSSGSCPVTASTYSCVSKGSEPLPASQRASAVGPAL